jgi:hypothetical protein
VRAMKFEGGNGEHISSAQMAVFHSWAHFSRGAPAANTSLWAGRGGPLATT